MNALLLLLLFHLSEFEPWSTESRRMRSYMQKAFWYLLLSTIILPSIGVSAAYIGIKDLDGGKSYMQVFLFRVSGTFFITYVCQRAFVGTIVQLLRLPERFVYQPWLVARAVSKDEKKEASEPWPFYYGSDYAILLNVFIVTLGGSFVTPVITPFGALYFFLKYWTCKYNFLYVLKYSPGRGEIAKTAYLTCWTALLMFEVGMTLIVQEIGTRAMWIAMVMLVLLTFVVGVVQSTGIMRKLHKVEISEPELLDTVRTPSSQQRRRTYINPFEALLSLYVITQKQRLNGARYLFDRWKNSDPVQ